MENLNLTEFSRDMCKLIENMERIISNGRETSDIIISNLREEFKPTSLAVAKSKDELKKIEEVEDCFILEFDPFETIDFSKLSLTQESNSCSDDAELSVLGEKGKVACRDFPHSRHVCAVYPFDKSPHLQHCSKCYCLICDVLAPCPLWPQHCDASDDSNSRPARIFL